MMPPIIHNSNMSRGLWRSASKRPDVVKIPAPIIFAMTMLVAGKRPSCLLRVILSIRPIYYFIVLL
jgi:hypothetical protein